MDTFEHKTKQLLQVLYTGRELELARTLIYEITADQKWKAAASPRPLTQKDCMLITYGDSIRSGEESPLAVLNSFLAEYCQEEITNVHLLPVFPYTSDDGFSVSDYTTIDPELGTWEDIEAMGKRVGIMMDAVINHSSCAHEWFQKCCAGEPPYDQYYIECDNTADYSKVTRPRTLPLLTQFDTVNGKKWYWTTFSEDQIDLNFASPYLLKEVLEILLLYAKKGARFIRLDAIGFAWKKLGTTCMHLKETHALIKLMRLVMEQLYPDTLIITETNVPHQENISYFGDGDEAHLVYQFPLPPLVLYTMLSGNTRRLMDWIRSLQETPLKKGTAYFNFLASHDGIGVRPVDGILTESEKQLLCDTVLEHGGRISYKQNPDGSKSPYELNINYLDAITSPAEEDQNIRCQRFLAAQAILLSLQGVPGIYYHSLLGSRNWYEGLEESGIPRKINREKLDVKTLTKELDTENSLRHQTFYGYLKMLRVRKDQPSFSPETDQEVMDYGDAVFALKRCHKDPAKAIQVFINVTGKTAVLTEEISGVDLLQDNRIVQLKELAPYQILWLKEQH